MNSKTCVNQQALGGMVCVGRDSVGIHTQHNGNENYRYHQIAQLNE